MGVGFVVETGVLIGLRLTKAVITERADGGWGLCAALPDPPVLKTVAELLWVLGRLGEGLSFWDSG